MKNIIRNGVALLGLALLSTQSIAQEAPKAQAPKPDYRLYMIGNSLTDQIYWGKFEEMAKSGGRNILLGSQRVPGAPIGWFVQHPDGGFQHGDFGPWKKPSPNTNGMAFRYNPFSGATTKTSATFQCLPRSSTRKARRASCSSTHSGRVGTKAAIGRGAGWSRARKTSCRAPSMKRR
jgi:hypothetical protein